MINNNRDNEFQVGEVVVSPSHNELSTHSQTLTLQPKVMAVLYYLARHQQRVISREELIEQLWPGRIVTHGSVQKSINSLRKAFSELMGDQEVIAHYSKRGYQLTIPPTFNTTNPEQQGADEFNERGRAAVAPPKISKRLTIGLAGLITAGLCAILLSQLGSGIPQVARNHQSIFTSVQGYTHETGHERAAEPHPDNQHLAYIRETFNPANISHNESHLIIRNKDGKDWQIASSRGSWVNLAWSPGGQYLVAIEVGGNEGQPLTPDFYAKADDFYSFHIFSLDLAQHRLVEKHLLSQWHGRIASVSWWDETTLEFVATQGSSSRNDRYRYAVPDQALSQVESQERTARPLLSAVNNKRTALVSEHKNKINIDFLHENQTSFASWTLDFTAVDISWIPDGSGVLVFSEEEQKLLLLYLNGEQLNIPLATAKDKVLSRPRFRADGKAIYYAEEQLTSNISQLGVNQTETTLVALTTNSAFNYAAVFSPKGDKVVYASVRNNQIHLWLVEDGKERQLTHNPLEKNVSSIIWSSDSNHLIYRSGQTIFHYNFQTATEQVLLENAGETDAIAFYPDKMQLLAVKQTREARNLWRISAETKEQKQLTFGALGSATEFSGDVYFQYTHRPGLWVLRHATDALTQVSDTLAADSRLLGANSEGVYVITGGVCRESDVYYLHFATDALSTYLARADKAVSTNSFHPTQGLLQSDCVLTESNLLVLE